MNSLLPARTAPTGQPRPLLRSIQTESKLYTAADDPQKIYDSKKGLGY